VSDAVTDDERAAQPGPDADVPDVDADLPDPPDLARNRAAMDAMFHGDGYAGHLGARLEGWGGGWSRVALTVADHHRNFAGWLHGGVTFGLGDAAFAVASNSWGRLCVALSVDVQFLASAAPGDELVAVGRERHRTARTAAYLIEVRHGAALVGSLHALVHRTGRWHLGEDVWSEDWRASH
jgi:acyl-CoA thioesterase